MKRDILREFHAAEPSEQLKNVCLDDRRCNRFIAYLFLRETIDLEHLWVQACYLRTLNCERYFLNMPKRRVQNDMELFNIVYVSYYIIEFEVVYYIFSTLRDINLHSLEMKLPVGSVH